MTYGSAMAPAGAGPEIAGLVQRTIDCGCSAEVVYSSGIADHIDIRTAKGDSIRVIDYGDTVTIAHPEYAGLLPVEIPGGTDGHTYLSALLPPKGARH